MAKLIDNCLYNKIKLLHNLSCTLWFIEKHAKQDARTEKDNDCLLFLEYLEKDLEKYVHELKKMTCM